MSNYYVSVFSDSVNWNFIGLFVMCNDITLPKSKCKGNTKNTSC